MELCVPEWFPNAGEDGRKFPATEDGKTGVGRRFNRFRVRGYPLLVSVAGLTLYAAVLPLGGWMTWMSP